MTPERFTLDDLTEREREVAGLVAIGLTDKAIGIRLDISPHTVRTHLAHISEKVRGDPDLRRRAAIKRFVDRWAGV